MSDDDNRSGLQSGAMKVLADRLVREADITEEQARELITLIGTDWNSLLREAHFLKARHRL
ncbi:hypothetical protein EN833_30580 [Mesorhizobium sp. M4B.F.Ca.ET.190.01.1.1]|uniref:hypothetical protein n=1 Tax=unclassified Mesorhizobium TaxID=325217 RepID=UPI001092ED72|nr:MULTISPECIES: hypothetical protein [unclassified Mesorhizobium]TGR00966.1 hypothetical protein EN843_30575 [Mesorhizobium sp. M4B.F.Ca.ET.200.01.1.1]TGS12683.1 hypothetical protein EN833_30580 [Mesorhizobium sp. M4B.F.Ca.ET.190.01.1.1]TGT25308.1 hypothetical protein EN815_30565 [Mesorhizobium sp. M4B.F.Ca.ET.172.01.1.1]